MNFNGKMMQCNSGNDYRQLRISSLCYESKSQKILFFFLSVFLITNTWRVSRVTYWEAQMMPCQRDLGESWVVAHQGKFEQKDRHPVPCEKHGDRVCLQAEEGRTEAGTPQRLGVLHRGPSPWARRQKRFMVAETRLHYVHSVLFKEIIEWKKQKSHGVCKERAAS